jgi:CheY-like chemotaxis protein/HPt (histidine-containing phosphotransfer) domain-containing protein
VVWVDAAQALATVDETASDTGQGWRFPAASVLIVDDGPENRELVKLVLEQYGLVVDEAENGLAGLEMVRSVNYDLVLMDVQMPVMDGFTATQTLRADGHRVPIIALTANAMKGFEDECLAAGFSDYFTKPIDIDRFVGLLARLLDAQPVDTSEGSATPARIPLPSAAGSEPASASARPSPLAAQGEQFAALAARFVGRLDEKLAEMDAAGQAEDYQALAGLAHWLKGAGGTVGFDDFTTPARRLEEAAKAADETAITQALGKLHAVARAVAGQDPSQDAAPPLYGGTPVAGPQTNWEVAEAEIGEPLVSRFAGHPRIQPMIDKFELQLADEMQSMRAAWERDDLVTLETKARWLKGAGGTFGFDTFTEAAEELESSAKAGDRDAIPELLRQVQRLVLRVQKSRLPADKDPGDAAISAGRH